MMKPLLVVVSYSVFPGPLVESVASSGIPVRWHFHYHGGHPELAERIGELSRRQADSVFYDHRVNCGLARSWNESLRTLEDGDHDVAFIINDDVEFEPGGFRSFFDFVNDNQAKEPGRPKLYTVLGREIGQGALEAVGVQGMACCAMNREMVATVGYFDEAFFPAYYEDCDLFRRMRLAGYELTIDYRTLCIHERSKTTLSDPDLEVSLHAHLVRNRDYYMRKWGGEHGKEVYALPFNGKIDA